MTDRNKSSGEPIATRLMQARSRQSGEQITVKINIGQPYWTEEEIEAACPVSFEGLYGKQPDIRGIDLIDALRNALNLVDTLLKGVQSEYELFWPDGELYEEP